MPTRYFAVFPPHGVLGQSERESSDKPKKHPVLSWTRSRDCVQIASDKRMISVKPALSVSAPIFSSQVSSRDPMRFPARARAHHPRARASLSVTLSTRAPLQSARSRRRQAAGISRRDRRMAPRGAVLRPRRFAPERCRGCSAILGVVIGEAGRSAGAKATTVARISYTEHKERDA